MAGEGYLHALDVCRVFLENGVDDVDDVFQSSEPLLHQVQCGIGHNANLGIEVLAVRAGLQGKLERKSISSPWIFTTQPLKTPF